MSQQFLSDTPTFDEINALRKPNTVTEWIPIDGALFRDLNRLRAEVDAAEKADRRSGATESLGGSTAAPLRAELEQLEEQAERAAVKFTATAIPRRRWRELVDRHAIRLDDKGQPVDPNQIVLRADGRLVDRETFGPAVITACIVEPRNVDGDTLWNEWDSAIAVLIAGMCITANDQVQRVPTGARSTARAAASEPSSTTAALEESLTATT